MSGAIPTLVAWVVIILRLITDLIQRKPNPRARTKQQEPPAEILEDFSHLGDDQLWRLWNSPQTILLGATPKIVWAGAAGGQQKVRKLFKMLQTDIALEVKPS